MVLLNTFQVFEMGRCHGKNRRFYSPAQLGLTDKGLAIKELVVCRRFGLAACFVAWPTCRDRPSKLYTSPFSRGYIYKKKFAQYL